MNKLEMAHEWAMNHGKSDTIGDRSNMIRYAWEYADAMQAEADKREQQKQDKLKQDQQNHHDALVSVGLEEWQPDWSQAPDGHDWFVVGGRSWIGYFTNIEPKIVKYNYWLVGDDAIKVERHSYIGKWQDSLRKRP